jgi:ribosomal-protein-alanine N-acetyltransferase
MNTVPVKLEPLRETDLGEILLIEEDLFGPEKWTSGMFRSELNHGHHYLVARDDDGTVVGYAGLAVGGGGASQRDAGGELQSPPDEAWVNNIAVRRDAQRRGVGRALLEALLAEATRRGVRRILLEVAVDNEPALALYAGYGFEGVSVRRRYYQPSNKDALVMMREE